MFAIPELWTIASYVCNTCIACTWNITRLHMRAVQVESDTFRDKILGQSNV